MTLQQACSMAHIHCLYTQSPQNAIQSQQTDKVGNNGIVEIYDVKSYQIESNVVMEFQFWIDGNLKLNQSTMAEMTQQNFFCEIDWSYLCLATVSQFWI